MVRAADVVVIGGAGMGGSSAFALALRKAGWVILLEKSFVGAGSSGKSGSIIRQHYSHPLLVKMAGRGGYGAPYSITPDWQPILDRLGGIAGAFGEGGYFRPGLGRR